MNAPSASRAERLHEAPATATSDMPREVLVWDLPVRVFHWTLVLSFAGAWLTAESERWRLLHVGLGYAMALLVCFRLVWGVIGTRHARFANFVRGPSAVLAYLRSLLGPRPQHHVGHNPAGAWAIVGLLALGLVVVAAGWATFENLGGEWPEELHEGAATLMLAVVAMHVAGVALSSLLHRENLVRAMFTGRKRGTPGDAIASPWRLVAALLVVAVAGAFAWAWTGAAPEASGGPRHELRAGNHDDDD